MKIICFAEVAVKSLLPAFVCALLHLNRETITTAKLLLTIVCYAEVCYFKTQLGAC